MDACISCSRAWELNDYCVGKAVSDSGSNACRDVFDALPYEVEQRDTFLSNAHLVCDFDPALLDTEFGRRLVYRVATHPFTWGNV